MEALITPITLDYFTQRTLTGKMEPPPTPRPLKSIIFDLLPGFVDELRGDDQWGYSHRHLYYVVRKRVQDFTDKPLNSATFEAISKEYEEQHGDLAGCYREARGYLIEPHTGNQIQLGTKQVASYTPPLHLYDKLLFVEKRAIWPIIEQMRIAERCDMAVVCSEGFAVRACRSLLGSLQRDQAVTIACVHDADPSGYMIEVKRFLEISSLDKSPKLEHAARKATPYNITTPAQLAWCFRAKQLAKTLQAAAFDRNNVATALPELHALTVSENLVHKVPCVLAKLGIRFVVVEPLPRSRIDGATLWLGDQSPVIAVSMRFDRIDGFWHTLAHELSHVLHGDISVDDDLIGNKRPDVTMKPPEEQRADEEASNFLVPSDTLNSFIVRHKPRFSKSKIVQFANLHQIHPGIVVGQLQFRQAIPYSHIREMLVPVRERLIETALTDGWGHVTSF